MNSTTHEMVFDVSDDISRQVDAIRFLANTLTNDPTDPTACGAGELLNNHIHVLGGTLDKLQRIMTNLENEIAAN